MNFFCRIFGHTWLAEIETPEVRWNTTKDGHTLVSTVGEESVRHFERCRRCDERREVGSRSHDADLPADRANAGAAEDASGEDAPARESA